MTRHSVLVVIPTYNEAKTIDGVVDKLLQDLPVECHVRFVVVDGGSTDGTQEIVNKIASSRSDIFLLNNPDRIQSAAVNLAVRSYGQNSDLLVRCDAHAAYPVGYIRRLVETFEIIGSDSVVVPMDTKGSGGLQTAVALISNTPLGSGGSAHRGGRRSGFVDHGHHALMRVDSFRRAGEYDETFTHNEDAEFDCRLRNVGGSIYLDAEIRIGYYPRSSFRSLWNQYYNYGKGRSRTIQRHPKSIKVRQIVVPGYLGLSLLSLAAAPWSLLFLTPTLLYLHIMLAASAWFSLGKKNWAGVLAGAAGIVMHSAWASGFVAGLFGALNSRQPSYGVTADEALVSRLSREGDFLMN